jgi:hypothetical protein
MIDKNKPLQGAPLQANAIAIFNRANSLPDIYCSEIGELRRGHRAGENTLGALLTALTRE